jgi:hypothetical protein
MASNSSQNHAAGVQQQNAGAAQMGVCDDQPNDIFFQEIVKNTRSAEKDGKSVQITPNIKGVGGKNLHGTYSLCPNILSDPGRAYSMTINRDGTGMFKYANGNNYKINSWGVLVGDGTEERINCPVVTRFTSDHNPPRKLPAMVLVYNLTEDGWRYTFLIDLDGKPVIPGPANIALVQSNCSLKL